MIVGSTLAGILINYTNTREIMIPRFLSILGLVILSNSLYGQPGKEFKTVFMEAEFWILEEDYQIALDHFESLLDFEPENANLLFHCGECCLRIPGRNFSAITYLEKAVSNIDIKIRRSSYKVKQAPAQAYHSLALAYQKNNQFAEAILYYKKYRDDCGSRNITTLQNINHQIASCKYAIKRINDPVNVRLHNMIRDSSQVNSITNPLISGDGKNMIYMIDKSSNHSIMMITKTGDTWSSPRKLNTELGVIKDYHPVSLSYDGNEMYLVKKSHRDSNVFMSRYKNDKWEKVKPLNKNINSRYRENHVSISKNGKILYFSSDRKGGYGGMDIYCSELDSGGDWGEIQNLGGSINTSKNEDTPFITGDGSRLYFSSDGGQTMGGYDILYAEVDSLGFWYLPVNLGHPLNSSCDDLFYNPGWEDNCHYYTWKDLENPISHIISVQIETESRDSNQQAEK